MSPRRSLGGLRRAGSGAEIPADGTSNAAAAAWIIVRRLSIQPPYPADSQTNRATNKAESTSSSQSVRVILPRSSFSNA